MKTKICTKCGKRKAISQFYKHSTTKDKLRPDCKECSDKFGKIRGLLCSKCNNAIGLFNDNVTILNRAINYLKNGEQHA